MWRAESLKRALRISWVVAIVVVIAGSLLPGDSAPMRALSTLAISDKFEHTVAYAFLAWLPSIHERKTFMAGAVIGAVALGIALEYAQLYSGWRDFEIADMVTDAAGTGCGVLAAIPFRSAPFFRRMQN